MNMLESAIGLALQVHAGQVDKAGMAYILHPLRLMLQMETEYEMITAVLHDVVEDGEVTLPELEQMGFPTAVLEALRLLTRESATTPYSDYVAAIRANPIARRVKLADLAHNMDVRRIPSPLTQEDWQRLAKYQSAWKSLVD